MKSFILLAVFAFAIYNPFELKAQPVIRTITGLVIAEGEETPLEGVAVHVKGTKNFSGSQPDGIFYITISPKDSVLVFSLQGFEPKEVRITLETEYHVTLKRIPNRIDNN